MPSNIPETRREVELLKNKLHDLEHQAMQTVRAYNAIISVMRRLGLPEAADAALTKIQALIRAAYALRAAFIAVQLASGYMGWILAGVTVVSSLMLTSEFIMELG